MSSIKVFVCINVLLVASSYGSVEKRGLFGGNFGGNYGGNNFGVGYHGNDLSFGGGFDFGDHGGAHYGKQLVIQKVGPPPPVSPAEIAEAISAAKEASTQVLQAQQRVQVAKESVLQHQRIATHKEQQAALATQKAEAAAAVQRQEANAAATAVVLAQQRLAQAKAEVAEHQRIAASKEQHAAHVIQKSASAAAVEIQRSEHTASKLAALQRNEATVYKHATAAKDATLNAASAAVAVSTSHYPSPWAPHGFQVGWHR